MRSQGIAYDPRRDAARGAALLDRVMPGWAARIATDRLAMESCDSCILGQIYGDFNEGFRTLLFPLPYDVLFAASAFGFTLSNDLQNPDFAPMEVILDRFRRLADAWRSEIAQRLPEGPR